LGVVQVANKKNRQPFNDDDARLLSAFAAQAAMILDNARLYYDLQSRALEAEGLRTIAGLANSVTSLDEVIQKSMRETAALMRCETAGVALLDEQTGKLILRPEYFYGFAALTDPFILDIYQPGMEQSTTVSKRPFLSNNVGQDERVVPVYRAFADRFHVTQVVQVPLIVRDRSIGELSITNRKSGDFSRADIRLLRAVAAQLSAVLDRSRLFESTDANLQARIDELDSLSRVSNELNLTIQLDRILEVIRIEAQRTTGALEATVTALAEVRAWPGPDQPLVEQRIGGDSHGTTLWPIERQSVLDNRVEVVKDYQESAFDNAPSDSRSALAVPVQFGEQPVGVIHVYSDRADAFAPRSTDFLKALANQAGIAFGNAARFRQQLERNDLLSQRADQINQIFELGRMIRSNIDLGAVLEAVATGISDVVGFNIVVINLADSKTQTLRGFAQSGVPLATFQKMQAEPFSFDQMGVTFKERYRISASYFLPEEDEKDWMSSNLPMHDIADNSVRNAPLEWHTSDALLTPLRNGKNELIGLISVDDPRNHKRPTQSVVESLEIFANQAAFAIENFQLLQAFQEEATATRQERDRLTQLYQVAGEIQRAPDIPTRLQVVADGIRAAGWGRVHITLRDENLEPTELIAAGYSSDELTKLRAVLLPGIVWRQRLADPDFRNYRIGQAYYLTHNDQWVTENKLLAGGASTATALAPRRDGPRELPTIWNSQDTVYLPMYGLDQSRLIGIIAMDSPQDNQPPTEARLRPIELFAVQAASAIENTRLYETTTRAAQQEQRLNTLMEAVASTLNVEDILIAVANGLQELIPYSHLSVGLIDDAGRMFETLIVTPAATMAETVTVESGATLAVTNTIMGRIYQELNGRIFSATVQDSDRALSAVYVDLAAWRAEGERTSLVVPLIAGGRTAGVLHLGTDRDDVSLFETQLAFIQRLANLTAVAIENARLFQQAIDRERFTASLARIGVILTGVIDLTNVLNTVCEEVVELIDLADAYLWLPQEEKLTIVAGSSANATQLIGQSFPQTAINILAADAFRTMHPIIVNDYQNQLKYISLKANVQAAMAVPLIQEQQVIGVLATISDRPGRQFGPADLERASAYASQAALALSTARLYQQTVGLTAFNDAIVQSIQQGIIVLDQTGQVRTINGFIKQQYAWTDEAIGQQLFVYRPNYVPFLKEAVEAALRGEQPKPLLDVRDISAVGRTVVRNFYVYPLLQADTVSGAVVLLEDVTERTALSADLEARARELTAFTEASSRLTSSLEPDAVAQLVLDQAKLVVPYDNATLWVRVGEKLVVRAARGYDESDALVGVEADIADSALFRDVVAHGPVVAIADATKDARFPANIERQTRSWMGVSLGIQERLLGLLVLEKTEPDYYRMPQQQLALAFANQAAVALENARLFRQRDLSAQENTVLYQEARRRAAELNQQAQRLALLNRVAGSLAQTLDIENVFEVTLSELIEVLGMDRGSAMVFEAEQHRARLVIEFPRADTPPHGIYIRTTNNLLYDEIRQTLRPVAIYDIRTDPRANVLRDFLERRGALSSLFVPLTVGGQLIGMISIDTTQEYHVYTPDQIELAQTIASQAAVAVQNANLFEQSVLRSHELETLFEATQATSSTLNLDEVIQSAARQMIPALRVDSCQIAMYDDIERQLVTRIDVRIKNGTEAISQPGTTQSLSLYPTRARVINERQTVIMYADDDVIDSAESASLAENGLFGRMIAPLVVRDQSIGLIVVEIAEKERRFDSAQSRLARALTNQTAVAIDNAQLQTETSYKLNELFIINELATALASSRVQDQIFRVVRAQMPTLVDAEIIILALYDADTDEVSYPVALRRGVDMNLPSHKLADDEISYVIRRRLPLLLAGDDVAEVLRIFNVKLNITQARSYLAVPLTVGDTILGALGLASETSARAFGLDDQRVLTTIGSQVGVSVQNSRLFENNRLITAGLEQRVKERTEELSRERDRLNFLFRITSSLTASLDIEQVLARALEMIAETVGAKMGVIMGVDSVSNNLMYRATYGIDPAIAPDHMASYTQNEGLAGWVVQSQRSVIVADVQDDARWLHQSAFDDEPRSAIAAMLEANEDILGVIMLYHHLPGQFNEDHLRLVTAAAGQIATAMNNADLYGLIREQAERLGLMVRREQVEATKNAAIVESIGDGVMVTDQSGEIVQFNTAAERVLAMTRRDVIGRRITELSGLYGASGGERWLETLQDWMDDPASHKPGDVLQEQLKLDNSRVVSVVLSPVSMGDQFLGTVSIFRDITRETEVDRMKSEFVATVSHELRTPMTSIKGYADLLLMGGAGAISDPQQRFLTIIKTNADRLSELVNDLLDISRIDRGTIKLSFQLLDVTETVNTTLSHLTGRIANDRKAMEVKAEIEPNLPLVSADFDKLVQIMNNLADNAFNYTYEGGLVTLRAYQEGTWVVMSVSDTGVGIPPENQERVFERFFRDESNQLVMETSGTGLGLAIVQDYVKMHNGQIDFESVVGEGTTFYVRLPVADSSASRQPVAAPLRERGSDD
jgi:PAS domain S-box-containing protein